MKENNYWPLTKLGAGKWTLIKFGARKMKKKREDMYN